MGRIEEEIKAVLYGSPSLPTLAQVRDGLRAFTDPEGIDALMEHLGNIEDAITRLAAILDQWLGE